MLDRYRHLNERQRFWALVIAVLALFVAFGLVSARGNSAARAGEANPYTIWRICQERAAAGLKAPASAQFPSFDDHAITGSGNGWQVESYVDAQNSFGAMIRTYYSCNIRFHSDSDTYDVTAFTAT